MGCYNSAVIDAPADKVWSKLRNFYDLSWAPAVVQSCERKGDAASTQIGARRVVNGGLYETLVGLDDKARTLRYSIDDGPEVLSKDNVQGYVGEVRVFPVTDKNASFVLWTSSWENSGGGVAEFCNPLYGALLGELKKSFAR
ncbi:MAG: SRPBCC family protein [Gammaproteobacteria bacterium]|nr:SRPBCC family protein [Gammaproteobacteria bacterium]